MNKLIKQNAISKRAADLVSRWAQLGISVSPVAHDRYWLLIDKLRGGRSWPLQRTDDLTRDLNAFAADRDMLTIMGWNVDDEPALLIGVESLLRTIAAVPDIYSNGFVLIDDVSSRALLVDIDDDEGIHTNRVNLAGNASN